MHYFEFPSKDTTLYESSESINTGLDEILEIRKDMNDDGSTINVSRALLKFDLTYVSKSISSGFQALIAGNNTMAGTIGPAVQGMGKIGASIVEGFNNPFVKAGLGA